MNLRLACAGWLVLALPVVALAAPASARDGDSPDWVRTAALLSGRSTDLLKGDDARLATAKGYGKTADRFWKGYEDTFGKPLADWGAKELKRTAGETVFYPFSGPDFVTVHRFYPDAGRYVLVAVQRAGRIGDLRQAEPGRIARLLGEMRTGLAGFSHLGFFITKELKEYEEQGQVLAQLLLFADREGYDVTQVEPIRIREDGSDVEAVTDKAKGAWDSVRLTLKRRDTGKTVLLDYLDIDLSDAPMAKNVPAQKFFAQVSQGPVLLKAASHLLQRRAGFKIIRDLMLDKATTILQDESGLAYEDLDKRFQVRLYGSFKGAMGIFKEEQRQEALAAAYKTRTDIRPLILKKFGYRTRGGASLQYADQRK